MKASPPLPPSPRSPPTVPAQLPGRRPGRTEPRRSRLPAAARRRAVSQGMSPACAVVPHSPHSLAHSLRGTGRSKDIRRCFLRELGEYRQRTQDQRMCLSPTTRNASLTHPRPNSQSQYHSKNQCPNGKPQTITMVRMVIHPLDPDIQLGHPLLTPFLFICSHQTAHGPLHNLAQCQSQEIQEQGRVCSRPRLDMEELFRIQQSRGEPSRLELQPGNDLWLSKHLKQKKNSHIHFGRLPDS